MKESIPYDPGVRVLSERVKLMAREMAQWAKSLLSKEEDLRLGSQKPRKTRHGSGCLQSHYPSTSAVRWGTRLGEVWELEGQLA